MKKLVMMCLVVSLVSVASAELVQNHDFTAGDDGAWGHTGYWGSSISGDIAAISGWGNDLGWGNGAVWQDTGATYAADTVYTMTVEWKAPSNDISSMYLVFIDALAWTDVAGVNAGPQTLDPENWRTDTFVLDTAAYPATVRN